MIQQSDLRSIVAQILKLDEFAVDEGKLWARLLEWSAAAVRKPEQLGPYADAVGESVKRIKTDANDGCGIHEMKQQSAILRLMSQYIRFGAMSKDFFVDTARKYLTREKSEEIMDFFLLGKKPEGLMIFSRAGLAQEIIQSIQVTEAEAPPSEAIDGFFHFDAIALASLLPWGTKRLTPKFLMSPGSFSFSKLQVGLHQQLRISSVRLTFSPDGTIWPVTLKFKSLTAKAGRTLVTGRSVDHKLPEDVFDDTLEIVLDQAEQVADPAALIKIEVFG